MIKKIYYGKEAKRILLSGVNKVADATKVTLGPYGRYVIIENSLGIPQLTKDGVTVIGSCNLEDNGERMGANALKLAAEKTALTCGDGTTTTVVLAQKILNYCLDKVEKGSNPVELKESLENELNNIVLPELEKYNISEMSIDMIKKIATTSSNNDNEIVDNVVDSFKLVGKDGFIMLEEGTKSKTEVNVIDGVRYDNGWASGDFTSERSMSLEDCYILVVNEKIERIDTIKHLIMEAHNKGKSLFIIADGYDPVTLSILTEVVRNKGYKICCSTSPLWGDMRRKNMEDIAALVDVDLCAIKTGIHPTDLTLETLGYCDKVVITDNDFILQNPRGKANDTSAYQDRIRLIEEDHKHTNPNNEWELNQHLQRLAKMKASIAIISVGGITELDRKEIRDRYDDVLKAVRSSIKGGVVSGGGTTYLKLSNKINGSWKEFLREPFKVMCYNAGVDFNKIYKDNKFLQEYDFVKSQDNAFYDFKMKAVIPNNDSIFDPYLVAKEAIINAFSVSMSILMTEVLIVDNQLTDIKIMHEKHKHEKPE